MNQYFFLALAVGAILGYFVGRSHRQDLSQPIGAGPNPGCLRIGYTTPRLTAEHKSIVEEVIGNKGAIAVPLFQRRSLDTVDMLIDFVYLTVSSMHIKTYIGDAVIQELNISGTYFNLRMVLSFLIESAIRACNQKRSGVVA